MNLSSEVRQKLPRISLAVGLLVTTWLYVQQQNEHKLDLAQKRLSEIVLSLTPDQPVPRHILRELGINVINTDKLELEILPPALESTEALGILSGTDSRVEIVLLDGSVIDNRYLPPELKVNEKLVEVTTPDAKIQAKRKAEFEKNIDWAKSSKQYFLYQISERVKNHKLSLAQEQECLALVDRYLAPYFGNIAPEELNELVGLATEIGGVKYVFIATRKKDTILAFERLVELLHPDFPLPYTDNNTNLNLDFNQPFPDPAKIVRSTANPEYPFTNYDLRFLLRHELQHLLGVDHPQIDWNVYSFYKNAWAKNLSGDDPNKAQNDYYFRFRTKSGILEGNSNNKDKNKIINT